MKLQKNNNLTIYLTAMAKEEEYSPVPSAHFTPNSSRGGRKGAEDAKLLFVGLALCFRKECQTLCAALRAIARLRFYGTRTARIGR